jgi:ABC-type transport system involved in cytochrome c biogenesis ATPase subunit
MASLFEAYRPHTLAEVVGRAAAVRQIQAVLSRSWGGRAFWIAGDSGTGKTTIARVIAAVGASEFGTEELDSQNLTPAKLREIERDCSYRILGELSGKASEAWAIRALWVRVAHYQSREEACLERGSLRLAERYRRGIDACLLAVRLLQWVI